VRHKHDPCAVKGTARPLGELVESCWAETDDDDGSERGMRCSRRRGGVAIDHVLAACLWVRHRNGARVAKKGVRRALWWRHDVRTRALVPRSIRCRDDDVGFLQQRVQLRRERRGLNFALDDEPRRHRNRRSLPCADVQDDVLT